MNIYVRRVDKQCINKQISILKETKTGFFEDKENVIVVGKKSNYSGTVTILLATDPRLGGDIKKIIKEEGDMSDGDLLLFTKKRDNFTLEIIKTNDSKYKILSDMFEESDKHLEIYVEEQDDNKNGLIGFNRIYYGIPGCGKSYKINAMLHHDPDFIDEANRDNIIKITDESDIIRTTFYLDYSNSDFIGQIYPSVDNQGNVSYKRIAGSFTKALEKAIKNPDKMIYLIIEEINRGNAAAIFGDTFQLLDRLKEDKNGRVVGDSEYPISNTFIEDYFEENSVPYTKGQIFIPHNLTLLATMNTSDQNVYPLDTAFKRRWDRKKVITNWNKVGGIKKMYVPYTDITWIEFVTTINEAILEVDPDSDVSISEDKQMGAYFVQKNMLTENPSTQDEKALIAFANNVIDYLYSDVTKFNHSLLFEGSINSYDKIYEKIGGYIELIKNNQVSNNGKNIGVLNEIFKPNIIEKFVDAVNHENNNSNIIANTENNSVPSTAINQENNNEQRTEN